MSKEIYDQQHNQSLAKALSILNAFSDQKPEWGIRELGRELKINPTTIFRLVKTMIDNGYLERVADKQTFSLGPRVLKLADIYHRYNPIPTIARKVFESFGDRFEHTLYMGCLSYFEVVFLAVQEGSSPVRVTIEPEAGTGLHSSALGKMLLAMTPDDFINEFLRNHTLKKYSPRTIDNPEALWSQVHEIREKRYAINDGEQYPDIGSLAVPIPENGGSNRFAISLAYPRSLITEKRLTIEELIPLAREMAQEISIRIHWTSIHRTKY